MQLDRRIAQVGRRQFRLGQLGAHALEAGGAEGRLAAEFLGEITVPGPHRQEAGELTLLSLTEVVLGPVWVWLGVGEVPSLYTVIGGLIVLAAITAQALSGVRRRPPVGVM